MTNLCLTPNWPAPDNIQSICTTVAFGNLADHAGEQGQVLANRLKLKHQFALPYEPAWLNQTHSNNVTVLHEPIQQSIASITNCDASYTALTNQACVVLTADCLPLLVCDKSGQQVAAIHAGWKGLANGIIAQTLSYFSEHKELLVWLGPAIGPKAFEVERDVVTLFLDLDPENKKVIQQINQRKWLIDIYQLAKIQLLKLKVSNIYGGEYCTYSQSDLFYSYRRDKLSGRMASMIWKKR